MTPAVGGTILATFIAGMIAGMLLTEYAPREHAGEARVQVAVQPPSSGLWSCACGQGAPVDAGTK